MQRHHLADALLRHLGGVLRALAGDHLAGDIHRRQQHAAELPTAPRAGSGEVVTFQ